MAACVFGVGSALLVGAAKCARPVHTERTGGRVVECAVHGVTE